MTKDSSVLNGDLAVFIDSVGGAMYSPEHLAVIMLAGPAMDIDEDVHKGIQSQYQYFSNNGVTLQFKKGLLVVALIELKAENRNSIYRMPERLIAELPLPTSRDDVRLHFGKPYQSHETMDLYVINDRYVRFDFDDNETSALTVVMQHVGNKK